MSRIYRDGCPWFHQSVLYTSFHILRSVPAVEDSLLEEYKSLTRETIAEGRALFVTPNGKYPLLPHMGWAEIIFDQHRPSGKAQFIPQFYREAIGLGDMEYARRALRATGVLSHSYDRHDLALLALEDATASPKPQLRETLVDLLANIRFYDEAAVDRFLAQHAGPDLTTRVLSATPSIRSADTFNWIDSFVNSQMLASEHYRLQVVEAYRGAGTSKSLSQGMVRVLKHVLNMIAGRTGSRDRRRRVSGADPRRQRRQFQQRIVDFARQHPWFGGPFNNITFRRSQAVVSFFAEHLPASGTLLDIGTGTGHVATILQKPGRAVVGCDIVNLLMLPLPYVLADGARCRSWTPRSTPSP